MRAKEMTNPAEAAAAPGRLAFRMAAPSIRKIGAKKSPLRV